MSRAKLRIYINHIHFDKTLVIAINFIADEN